jgi:hypothetical protein
MARKQFGIVRAFILQIHFIPLTLDQNIMHLNDSTDHNKSKQDLLNAKYPIKGVKNDAMLHSFFPCNWQRIKYFVSLGSAAQLAAAKT